MSLLEIWQGSRLVLENAAGGELLVKSPQDPVIMYFLLALLLVAMIMFGLLRGSDSRRQVWTAFILLMPFYAFALYRAGVCSAGYWWAVVATVSFFAYKYLMFRVLGWVTKNREAFGEVESQSNAISVLAMILSMPAAVFPGLTIWYMAAVAVLTAVIYFFRVNKIFISCGFSVFFRFLYLCALEILPILVVVKAVVLTNAN